MRAVLINEWGGPEVLQLADDQPEPEPEPGQQRIHVTAAGVNFADTHARENASSPSTSCRSFPVPR